MRCTLRISSERIQVRLVSTGQVIQEDISVARARILDGTAELVNPADAEKLNLVPKKARAETTALEPRSEMAVSLGQNPAKKTPGARRAESLGPRTAPEICRDLGTLLDELARLETPVPKAYEDLTREARLPGDVALWIARLLPIRAATLRLQANK